MVSADNVNVSRVILGLSMMYLLSLTSVNSHLKRFTRSFIFAFSISEFVFFVYTVVHFTRGGETEQLILWRTYEIIRLFMNLSLCYPIFLALGKDAKQLQSVFIFVVVSILISVLYDFFSPWEHSGINHVAFLLVFFYTHKQYRELNASIEGSISNLRVLVALEEILIALTAIYVLTYFSFVRFNGQSFRLCVSILQYFKFFLAPSTMGSIMLHKSPI